MGQRILIGVLTILSLLLLFAVDVLVAELCPWEGRIGDLLRRGSVLPIVLTIVVLAGAMELARVYQLTARRVPLLAAYVLVAILMLSPWLSAAGWLGQRAIHLEGLYWQIVWLGVSVIGTAVLVVLLDNPGGTIRTVGAIWIMILYLGFLNSFAVQLRCGHGMAGSHGAWLLLVILLITKASDIGAYFVGSAIGRHPLSPKISPNKTIEGAIGGLFASGAVSVGLALLGVYAPSMATADPSTTFVQQRLVELWLSVGMITMPFGQLALSDTGHVQIFPAFIFGVAMSAAAQVGDLFESSFKREAGIKDSGNLLPRFGGILDLIDSPTLAVPVAWFLLTAGFGVA